MTFLLDFFKGSRKMLTIDQGQADRISHTRSHSSMIPIIRLLIHCTCIHSSHALYQQSPSSLRHSLTSVLWTLTWLPTWSTSRSTSLLPTSFRTCRLSPVFCHQPLPVSWDSFCHQLLQHTKVPIISHPQTIWLQFSPFNLSCYRFRILQIKILCFAT